DLKAYAHNLGTVRHLIPPECAVMAVVKANAYGHGLVPMARKAQEAGAAMLGVATIDAALALREGGVEIPALVMVQPAPECLPLVVEHNLRLMVSDVATAERLGEIAHKANKVLPVHCKVDTGMGRQGFTVGNAISDMLFMTRISNIDIEGVATHFPVADRKDDAFTLDQIKIFKRLLRELDKNGIPYETAHAANSAGIINYPSAAFGMVRAGLMTYGVWPTAGPPPALLQPVLRWESRIVLLKTIEPGHDIGYGRTYTAVEPMRAAIVPVGYGDGYKHALANNADVLIRGQRCRVRGAVSMDQIVADVSKVPGVSVSDTVTLIGTGGKESVTVEELAERAKTIPYDILTGIGPRVRREYQE
ncbi:MAG: alanine racemase, partial [Nitrospiraceae bacterium]|nr:alanine racemase [Nitrospiraceae bacterium]